MHTHACNTMKRHITKYAVDASLFRLGSTDPKKIHRPWILFFVIFLFQKCFLHFFFKSVQIHMKDAESADSKGKSNSRDFQFFIFRVMVIIFVIFVLKSLQFFMNFYDNLKIKIGKLIFH